MDKIIELKLTLENVNVIMAALGKMPYESVFQVVKDITDQAQSQLQEHPSEATENK